MEHKLQLLNIFRDKREALLYRSTINNELDNCQIYETDNGYIIKIKIPGAKKNQIKINYLKDILIISWRKKIIKKSGFFKNKKHKAGQQSFSKNFKITGIDSDTIQAKLKKGILQVSMEKTAKFKSRKIKIFQKSIKGEKYA